MDTSTVPPDARTRTLPSIASTLSAVIAAAFVGSVSYDWGFFAALGIWFNDFPTSLADHTQTALIWAPPLGLGVLIAVVLNLFTQEDDPKPEPPKRKTFLRWLAFDAPYLLIAATSIFVVVMRGESAAILLGVLAAFVWTSIATRWAYASKLFRRRGAVALRAFFYVPIALAVAFAAGWTSAIDRSWSNEQIAIVRQHDGDTRTVRAVRSFERGLLYRDRGRLHFARWDSVVDLATDLRPARFGYSCHFSPCENGVSPDVEALPAGDERAAQ